MVEFNVKVVIWSLDFHGGEEVSSLEANMLKVAEGNGEYVKGEYVKGEYVKGYRREQHICLSRQSNALSQNYNFLALSPEKRKRCTAFRYTCKSATLPRI